MRFLTRDFMAMRRNALPKAFALSFAAFAMGTTAYVSTTAPALAQEFRFSNVVIDGNGRVSPETILSTAGIARGVGVSAGELNDAYQSVLASGLFESVEFIPNGSTLTIKVAEFPTVSRIAVEGNRQVGDEAILAAVATQVRRAYSPATVEQDAALITDIYETRSQLSATVTPKIIRRSDNRVDVVFEVTEGKQVEVERVSFVGNRTYSDGRLRRVLETKQAGIFRFLIGQDTYAENRVAFDRQVLTDFYTSRGYVDFEIRNVAAEFSRERNAFFVSFNINEGQPFAFGDVTVSSQLAEADASEFEKVMNIRAGQTYSPVAIENVVERMERLATKNGIDFLRVEPVITRNDRAQTLDIDFQLVRGPRIFIERIDIEGNATTLDRVVRQKFEVVEGDPFNPRQIREAAERIRALGFFSTADVEAREGSNGQSVVVDVDVAETTTGSLSFGANYSVSDGIDLVASYSESNFLGRGQQLGVNLTTDVDDGSLRFSFTEPAFLGRDVLFGLSLGYGVSSPSYADHQLDQISFAPRLTFNLTERSRLSLRYGAYLDEISNPDENDLPTTIQNDVDAGEVFRQTLGYSYTFDSRRNGVNPNAGVRFEFSQDYAGLGGDVEYLRTTAELSGEAKILHDEVTLRATLEGGAIHGNGMDTRISDRFFSSSSIIRGFETGGIGPRDTENTDLALGGNYYAVARLEANFPIGLPEEYGITGGLFLDHGSIWGLDDATDAGSNSDEISFRTVIGASIFLDSPLGPLRLNFTKALEKEEFDDEQTFDLTIATSF